MHILYASQGPADHYLTGALQEAGHVLDVAVDPADGPDMAAEGGYQAILLDWPRPPADWTARYAAAGDALIVVVATHGDQHERSAVLRAGADACFVRPLPFVELEARLQALDRVVRRARPRAEGPDIQLLPAERAVRLGRAQAELSVLEFRLLEHLVQHAGEVVGISDLRRAIWGEEAEPRPEPVHACASRLRRKLATINAAACLQTVAGYGYVFRPEALS
jgi:two-component system OmpR family response regulator